jgi:multiple sugar transport system substrate-binding protein
LLEPQVQQATLSAIAFFPVVKGADSGNLSPGLRAEAQAASLQQTADNALPSPLPVGLGEQSADFDKAFTDTFQKIVRHGDDPAKVLGAQAGVVQKIMDATAAPCWQPDPASTGPCKVK